MLDDAETSEKSATLSPQTEAARVKAGQIFPNNPRASELLAKSILFGGVLPGSEQSDPNVVKLGMGEGKAIEVKAGDPEKAIFTTGLNGCLGTLVYAESSEGDRVVIMTHYDGIDTGKNLTRLDELLDEHPAVTNYPVKEVLFEIPGYKQKDDSVIHAKATDTMVEQVEAKLKDKLGITQTKKERYVVTQGPETRDAGVLVAVIPQANKAQPKYRTWFSQGKLGRSQ